MYAMRVLFAGLLVALQVLGARTFTFTPAALQRAGAARGLALNGGRPLGGAGQSGRWVLRSSTELAMAEDECVKDYDDLEPGDVVEVIADDITFWHPLPYRKTGVNPKGWRGIFVKNKINWTGALTTANRPVMVQVLPDLEGQAEGTHKCICHFELEEIKLVMKATDELRARVPKRKV
uniref:Ferredoxin thioredoxin reductase alpha chain domain-containing protein n=1 Tax=Phaeomonas parva TaxID=124430 RepID=A0A6U4GVJ5_9STRA|mmetsp:Transcript_32895/g.104155  ORF Transcript_32895/g.104155 Transcript_32895/m.104155 type:complete len:178 (+) Transcript_32895:292-825(+)|eukprot:CAMPEP_0118854794 /NCGR_PEP_ID=MMETSP1163-20130328/2866_1 /TAXON_ID=124430 /ORGANISM="Phaeomonas parva, Strain CCMP2877" /LENGTH=177 /DNA_ID=CAMNT_0006787569 /DNA_START=263 /DNA_END=796 /DNA_ORIENTATION=+